MQTYDGDEEKHGILEKVWANVNSKVDQIEYLWQVVAVLAGALIAMLKEIKWSMTPWHEMITHEGNKLDVVKARLTWVVQQAKEAVGVKLWHESSMAQQDLDRNQDQPHDDVPWWEPLRKIVNGKDKAIANAAKSVVVGTQWPQARMHDAKMQDIHGYKCKACDTEEPGTMQHRHCRCPAYRDHRSEYLSAGSRRGSRSTNSSSVGRHPSFCHFLSWSAGTQRRFSQCC